MPELTDVNGVSDARAEDLRDAGYTTVDDIATADFETLTDVSGIGPSTADDLVESAQDVIRETTLQGDEETQDADDEDDYEPTEVEEPTEDDLRELVEDDTEDGPDFEDMDAEDDEDEPEETTVEIEEPYTVTFQLETQDEYDYLMHAMLSVRLGQVYVSGPQREVSEAVLNAIRPLGGAGEAELTLNTAELNALFTSLRKAKVSYQGIGDGQQSFNAISEMLEQVQSVREEFVL